MLFSDSHIACLILLVMARNWLRPSVVVDMPITDTRHPFSIQPPSLWPSKAGDRPNPIHGNDESDNDDDNDDHDLDEDNGRQTDDELEEPEPFNYSDVESPTDPTNDNIESDVEDEMEPPKKSTQTKRPSQRSQNQGRKSKKQRIYPDIENMDIDEEPEPRFTSTPTSTRPSTAKPSTSSSGRKRFIPPFNPPASSSSSGYRSASSTNNRRMEVVESYLRDLNDFIDGGKDTKVARFGNFNGRSCYMIAVVKAILFCLNMPGVHVQRPNSSMDEFSRLLLDFFWNHSSSEHSPNFEPVVDAFIHQYMAIEERAYEDDPGNPELHPKARMYETKLILERLAGQYNSAVIGHRRQLRSEVILIPNIVMKPFHISLRSKSSYEKCCSNNNHDEVEDKTVGILDISVFDFPANRSNMTVQSVIEWYLSSEFPLNQIQCHGCQKMLHGVRTFEVTNHPDFLPIGINRAEERIQIGDVVNVNEIRFECIAAVQHCGLRDGGHYS